MGGFSAAETVAMPRTGDDLDRGVVLPAEFVAQAWESFALNRYLAGVCDRTLRPNFGRGAVPCPAAFSFKSCPAFLLLTGR